MKLWLIVQMERRGYDTYDSAVVAAETADEAIKVHPDDYEGSSERSRIWESYTWASSPDRVSAEYLGEAAADVKPGVILASFNAG